MTRSIDPFGKASRNPFQPSQIPLCLSAIRKHSPLASEAVVVSLGIIWDEVVHRIIEEMMDLVEEDDAAQLHIDIREDMILELAQLQIWLGERVIEKRIDKRPIANIDPDVERESCLGFEGADTISGTARMAYEHIWKRKTDERWKPKSAKAIQREANPRKAKLAVKPVEKNHFIPRWFLKDNWATNDKLLRWRKTKAGWSSTLRNFGQWGHRRSLYSNQLEAYFSLLEGDAKRPVEMLLTGRPLNGPQREAFVGFLIIQMLRNPHFMETIEKGIAPVIAETGHADDPTMARRAYETLFRNNELYDQLARPIMWSRWAIVKFGDPVFVLPDRFGIHSNIGDGLRMIVPLTPKTCFVTLLERETEKRIAPHFLLAPEPLARRISATLMATSIAEFVSHPEFSPDQSVAIELSDLLSEIGGAIASRQLARGERD